MPNFSALAQPFGLPTMRTKSILVAGYAAGLLVMWYMSSAIFPRPHEVLAAFGPLWTQQGLGHDFVTSLVWNIAGIWSSLLISLTLAYGQVLPGVRPLTLLVTKLRFIGGVAGVSLIFNVVVGGGWKLRFVLMLFAMVPFLTKSLSDIVDGITRDKLNHARTLRMSEWRTVWEVVVLGTLYDAFKAFQQNACIAWMMITTIEGFTRSLGGVGTILLNEQKHMELGAVFAIQLLFMCAGLLQDVGIAFVANAACPYGKLRLARG